jgi:choline dehydrogenase-like flavoprotein
MRPTRELATTVTFTASMVPSKVCPSQNSLQNLHFSFFFLFPSSIPLLPPSLITTSNNKSNPVSFGNYTYPVMQDFLRAVESQGIPVTDDLQDLKTGHGACHWEKWINRDTGRRSDSAHAYIHSTRAHHSNLHLVCNTKVEKIIMEGGRAVGVKTVPTKPLTPGQDQAKVYRARKQIVVSGGTLSSPLILQRSGIGK